MKKLFVAGMLAISCGAMAQSEISEYRPGVTSEGAVYFLPKTALRITVQIEKTTYTPGDFSKYAERYLRLNDVEQKPSTTYRVTNIGLTSFGKADKKKGFAVKYSSKGVTANVTLAEDGRLLAINAEAKEPAEPEKFVPKPKPTAENPRKYMSEEILASGSVAKMAEMTAQEIYDIRDSKNQLNRGEADFMPKDGEQLKIMLNNLDTQDRMLTQLFTGTTVKDTTEEVLIVCSESEVSKMVLFRLSKKLGMVDNDDLSGTPYYLSIEDLHSLPPTTMTTDTDGKKKKKAPESGIYVNVPGKIKATITKGNSPMGSFELYAGQFGNVELLSGELFNKRATTHLTLNPVTGAVLKLDAELPK